MAMHVVAKICCTSDTALPLLHMRQCLHNHSSDVFEKALASSGRRYHVFPPRGRKQASSSLQLAMATAKVRHVDARTERCTSLKIIVLPLTVVKAAKAQSRLAFGRRRTFVTNIKCDAMCDKRRSRGPMQRTTDPRMPHTLQTSFPPGAFLHPKQLLSLQAVVSDTMYESPELASKQKVEELIEFLKEDSKHLFDDQGIDRSRYEESISFVDPITRYSSLSGYLFNIAVLRRLFNPDLVVLGFGQTDEWEITARWTMKMTFALLPWRPVVVFTGRSIYNINPVSGKFCGHRDVWDSISNQEYFSIEGVQDVVGQMLKIYLIPEAKAAASYMVVKRAAKYEVREYAPTVMLEGVLAAGEGIAGSQGYQSIRDYFQGVNQSGMKFEPTVPILSFRKTNSIAAAAAEGANYSSNTIVQVPLSGKQQQSETFPEATSVGSRLVDGQGGVYAVLEFSGAATDGLFYQKETELRQALLKDRLSPLDRAILARYYDPDSVPFLAKNEVLIPLENFALNVQS
ncbi:hypothetical protein CBR_g37636 [Chara braunii]|uniref:SOUL heme-binding protein n=1 Tax=Chara braunii TaxID=69332 RepID=A0A388LND4_CHABU|nr:hypothetical protein CBR_g37636 [Chara braunii]|eukprot:GBG83837.1 hypothetical protein CBR_g37636 [Chara braunii]